MTRDIEFFRGIRQFEAQAGEFKFPMPIFYYDASAFLVVYSAPYDRVVKLLPSPRLKPYRLPRKRALVILAAFSYRDTDIGPYNEFALGAPAALDAPVNLPRTTWMNALLNPALFITHLPVTTEIALAAGKEIYNFPKFLADISFETGADEVSSSLSVGDDHILTLTIPRASGERRLRVRLQLLTCLGDRILRSEGVVEGSGAAFVRGGKKVRLSLGENHFMAKDLAELNLGRPLAASYMPHCQIILTNPLEAAPVLP